MEGEGGNEFFVVKTFSDDDTGDSNSERCLSAGLNGYPPAAATSAIQSSDFGKFPHGNGKGILDGLEK